MESFGDAKIKIIREVKGITGLALKAAKDLVESAPCVIKADLPKAEADKLAALLSEVGGTVKVE